MPPVDLTRTTRAPHKTSGNRMTVQEEPSFFRIFDRFRGREGVDILWVKEQVYGSPCLPEECPSTRSMVELCDSLGDCSLELEEGEIDPRNIAENLND